MNLEHKIKFAKLKHKLIRENKESINSYVVYITKEQLDIMARIYGITVIFKNEFLTIDKFLEIVIAKSLQEFLLEKEKLLGKN